MAEKKITEVTSVSSLNDVDSIFVNQGDALKQINVNDLLLDVVYPIGAVYISYESTSPAELFGGSWTAITGVFPYFNAGTETGGSNTHTLTIAQMPSHNHSGYVKITGSKLASGSTYSRLNDNGGDSQSLVIGNTGGGQAHNNMPAYQTFYAWRRTA